MGHMVLVSSKLEGSKMTAARFLSKGKRPLKRQRSGERRSDQRSGNYIEVWKGCLMQPGLITGVAVLQPCSRYVYQAIETACRISWFLRSPELSSLVVSFLRPQCLLRHNMHYLKLEIRAWLCSGTEAPSYAHHLLLQRSTTRLGCQEMRPCCVCTYI